ncbi:unnamed protein product [Hydatigera taeniaeformis]|uniref:Protein KTI12 homolog n=1 Tax=Hydatigena taeniaeformis TaxID=6205 RepID=A0A0R3X4S7_HYDTA|nr:unnamed protein product [Hydatigera taeniaeformis]
MDLSVQVSFSTRDTRYSVPSHPISVPRSSTTDDLRDILRELLQGHANSISFDFLLHNEFIEGTLDEFLSKKNITLVIFRFLLVTCIITGSYDGAVQLQDVKCAEPIFTLSLGEQVKSVEWIKKGTTDSEDSIFVTGGFAQFIRIWVWNAAKTSVECVAVCRGHKETIMSLSSSSSIPGCNVHLLASSSYDSTIKVWSSDPAKTDLVMETGGVSHKRKSEDKIPVRIPRVTLAGHRNMVSRVSWYSEGVASTTVPKLISCSWDQSIRLWDVDTGSDSQTVAKKCGETRCIMVGSALHDLSVAPQGVLVAASDNKVRIFDLRAKDALAQIGFQSHEGWLTSITWAPHRADQFVTGSVDKLVKLWDTRRISAPLFDLMGHQDIVTAVDWAPPDKDGQHYIVSASADGTAKAASKVGVTTVTHFLLKTSWFKIAEFSFLSSNRLQVVKNGLVKRFSTQATVCYEFRLGECFLLTYTLCQLHRYTVESIMPLILLCGYPCSGKTVVTMMLAGLLREQNLDCAVEVISEAAVARAISPNDSSEQDPRIAIFTNASLEKQLRSQINSTLCVLVDANNYIKGYRYEMYCVAKALRQQQAVVYCTTSEATCRANNAQAARYPQELFTDLVNRFEPPNGVSRWDSPLYEICLPGANGPLDPEDELKQSVEDLANRVIHDLLQSTVKIKPNRSTIVPKSAAADYVQVVERTVNKVISIILAAQSRGDKKAALPNQEDVILQLPSQETWTPATLAKAKRHFFAFIRSEARLAKLTNEDEISVLFVRFLGNETQRLTSLT